ncbi:RDD family protein [Aeromicrobium piscarium]|uniref:RDD family protein n=1 Tax=Aeromicrobium piscarium TaxID=2590901 RepID=A0A554S9T3_9ACTN|nr:RDD family protein [Aeromicrobium piscarium]TSD63106.1 RDD family protein [Aeromicrobium piscarium]
MSGGPSAAPPLALAPLATRVGAWILDLAVAVLAGAIAWLPGLWIVGTRGTWAEQTDGTVALESAPAIGLLLLGVGVIVQLLVSLWNQGLRQGRTGRSIAKSKLGLATVDPRSGEPIGAARGVLRWLAAGILGSLCLLTYLWAIIDPRRRTWHDLIAGSLVVRG